MRMLNTYRERDSATRGELRSHDGSTRGTGFHKIVEDAVCHRFIERALATIRCEIKFERLAFDAETVGHVIDIDPRKIGLTSDGANRSEIICFKVNTVISFRSRIRKCFQARLRWRGGKFRIAVPQQC